ncbi:hypothetical protein [Alphabaculovirus myunipunctae]|uniref:Uncharacterized protein n=1 Tax=Mythimna unipuncta nucleopolyhedrovirus TaxID=447897 RepID=A0A2K9VSA1_9ABAC|nr:hypothetical protein [Mythimna unipuncta nucleopolyhedrovirus]AUV65320.1 hypothetical protein [Mythimna unipuncta nucleopolyhedrovirus]
MSTYGQRIETAQRQNVARRVVVREIMGSMNKVDTALSTNRDFCLNRYNKSTNLNELNNDHRRCPSLYEAEAINGAKYFYRKNDCVKRCVVCAGVLHLVLDARSTTCARCATMAVAAAAARKMTK